MATEQRGGVAEGICHLHSSMKRNSLPGQEVATVKRKRRIHDGIAVAVIIAGVALGYYMDPLWLLVPGLLGVTLLQSGVTGFCPVYYLLDRTCAAE